MVTSGLVLAGVGLLVLGFVDANTGYGNVWWRLAVVGVGFALAMSPLTGAAIQAVLGAVVQTGVGLGSAFVVAGAVTLAGFALTGLWLTKSL
ncbi:hypothetical protein [Amycolatopsis methanolica]|uniref:hypothetical protein n=1 Tax=Amycolatopsis methanolica TaxID=1814 RepID=UPI0003A783AE|nr:hypothetical protein [Amycolatopsis methanolica]